MLITLAAVGAVVFGLWGACYAVYDPIGRRVLAAGLLLVAAMPLLALMRWWAWAAIVLGLVGWWRNRADPFGAVKNL